MRILLVGDIVGSPGRGWFKEVARRLLGEGRVHAIVANAENAAAGSGITAALAEELFEAGATLLTRWREGVGTVRLDAALGFLVAFPLAIPVVLHGSAWAVMPTILSRVFFVAILPFLVALTLRRLFGERARTWGRRLTPSTLYVWIVLVAIIAASASRTLDEHAADYARSDILWVLLIDFLLCVFLFALGALLGGRRRWHECSQLLGQKNTSYTVYLAFACGAPFAALGPAFYVFFHNAWNGIQLIFAERARRAPRACH